MSSSRCLSHVIHPVQHALTDNQTERECVAFERSSSGRRDKARGRALIKARPGATRQGNSGLSCSDRAKPRLHKREEDTHTTMNEDTIVNPTAAGRGTGSSRSAGNTRATGSARALCPSPIQSALHFFLDRKGNKGRGAHQTSGTRGNAGTGCACAAWRRGSRGTRTCRAGTARGRTCAASGRGCGRERRKRGVRSWFRGSFIRQSEFAARRWRE